MRFTITLLACSRGSDSGEQMIGGAYIASADESGLVRRTPST